MVDDVDQVVIDEPIITDGLGPSKKSPSFVENITNPSASASLSMSVFLSREGHLRTDGRVKAVVKKGLLRAQDVKAIDSDRLAE